MSLACKSRAWGGGSGGGGGGRGRPRPQAQAHGLGRLQGWAEAPQTARTSDPGTGSWNPGPRVPGQLALCVRARVCTHVYASTSMGAVGACACVGACTCVCAHARVSVRGECALRTCVCVCRVSLCTQEDLGRSPTHSNAPCDGDTPWTSLGFPFPP